MRSRLFCFLRNLTLFSLNSRVQEHNTAEEKSFTVCDFWHSHSILSREQEKSLFVIAFSPPCFLTFAQTLTFFVFGGTFCRSEWHM